jgi:hypothetical protein
LSTIRLYRVDDTPRAVHRPVLGLTGRWFSDDPAYIDRHYGGPGRQWVYVDIPIEIAEQYRYERLKGDLYGVEGKDFVLPQEWADKRQPCERPNIETVPEELLTPLPLSEITSNVAYAGRVLDYNGKTGCTTVVEKIIDEHAIILTKNRALPRDMYIRRIVPIRKVKRLNFDIST